MSKPPVNLKAILPANRWSVGLRWVDRPMLLPRVSGAYILLLHLAQDKVIKTELDSTRKLMAGYYFYVGHASGVSGLATKVSRHWLDKKNSENHAAIDNLRHHMTMQGAWIIPDNPDGEILTCEVAQSFSESQCENVKHNNNVTCDDTYDQESHMFYLKTA